MSLAVDLYNFIYIAVIVLGGITLPLTLILQLKERDKYHRALALFVGAIFVYMITDFVTYYFGFVSVQSLFLSPSPETCFSGRSYAKQPKSLIWRAATAISRLSKSLRIFRRLS